MASILEVKKQKIKPVDSFVNFTATVQIKLRLAFSSWLVPKKCGSWLDRKPKLVIALGSPVVLFKFMTNA